MAGKLRRIGSAVAVHIRRVFALYVGRVEQNSIEYWQRSIFYVIAFIGTLAGTLSVIPVCIWLALTGRTPGLVLAVPFLANVLIIFRPRVAIKAKTLVIALNFYLIAVVAFMLAGPEGGSGIWFTVSVLILSLFGGFRISLFAACVNFATEMVFAVLHAKGLISWHVLKDFKFFSWVIQAGNIFLFDVTFAAANAILIRGVDGSFKFLKSAEMKTRELLVEQANLKDEIKAELVEKEVLLRELHHRVKNNLALVASMIRLSSIGIEDPRSLSAFEASYRRIDSIALLHEELYSSENLANLDFGPYLKDIAQRLLSSSARFPDLSLSVDADPMILPMGVALPLALIANELITNSLKYAFPGSYRGSIRIRLSRDGEEATLCVSDDGIGLPPGIKPELSTSLGFVLVYQLTRQIDAGVEYRVGPGTEFIVRFRHQE